MSITIKCDFCGKVYENRTEMLNISVWEYGASTRKGGKKIERMDYCKGCWNKLKHTAPNYC